ncbi:hypothetical protein EUGRSUZ_A02939 [Eucalyptus grandis]|uniref:Uncharacterized protein n=2 Tax=Eucalyptus grandis TaxID=71139 RepID=A0ACC3M9K2_EUCGR|nr:hypothetical protein EUGRSUZ_A02939 [Eucalyptus grandis]
MIKKVSTLYCRFCFHMLFFKKKFQALAYALTALDFLKALQREVVRLCKIGEGVKWRIGSIVWLLFV